MAFRMLFLGSDPIALPALEAIVTGGCGEIDLLGVYTQPDRPRGRGKKVVPNEIKTWALDRGLPVWQPEKMGKSERLAVAALDLDSILVMAYGHILSQRLLETPRFGIWNLHTSLLPKYRGASPIQSAIASGDTETGVSLMKLVREMDAGPVLDVETVRIGEEDTALDIEARLAEACVPLLKRALPLVHGGSGEAIAQDSENASYVRKLGKQDGELDFREPGRVVARRVNGLYPWPGARARLGEDVIKIGLAVAEEGSFDQAPGMVICSGPEGVRVACGEGVVLLKRLQRPGGKMLDAAEFVRGFELPAGAVFESRPHGELVTSTHVSS